MFNIFSKKNEAFGLDISDLSLRIAGLKKGRNGLKLASFGSLVLSSSLVENGEIKNKQAVAEKIKEVIEKVRGEKLKTDRVICSLPEEKSFFDIIRLPKIKEEEAKSAVEYEIENHIPLSLSEVYFDCEVINANSENQNFSEVLIAAVRRNIVDSCVETLKMAGLKPQVLEIECQSIARVLVKNEDTSAKSVLVIDFGETRTTFIVFSGKSIRFTSTIPISSRNLTQAISKNLKIPFEKAEKMKIKHGLKENKDVFDSLIPSLVDLSQQIKLHIDYWRSREKKGNTGHQEKELEKIVLGGGGANLKGLTDFLASQLKIPVKLGNPWVNILKEPLKEVPELPFEKSLSYTTALGLALRGINN